MKKIFIFVLCLFLVLSARISFAEDFKAAEWLLSCFPEDCKIAISPLSGGLSSTSLYKVEVDSRLYVLRIHHRKTLQDQREHFALVEAAKKGIAPNIVAISPGHEAIIIEYIHDKTISIEQAKAPEIIAKIAHALLAAHQIEGHEYPGETLLSKAKRCADKVSNDGIGTLEDIQGALQLLKRYRQELSAFSIPKVNVHGDLNPRNIFYSREKVLLIDWAESNREDPFYDLTYFALKHDYCKDEEHHLLTAYLMRVPTSEELERFNLQKKIHQAFWSLTNLYLAQAELNKHPEQSIAKNRPLDSWGSYQQSYAEGKELDAQYFYDLSRLNYMLAQ